MKFLDTRPSGERGAVMLQDSSLAYFPPSQKPEWHVNLHHHTARRREICHSTAVRLLYPCSEERALTDRWV